MGRTCTCVCIHAHSHSHVHHYTSHSHPRAKQKHENTHSPTCIQLYQALGTEDVSKAFAAVDTDNNGAIDRKEFTAVICKLDIGLSDAQIHELMQALDQNRDGMVDLGEFKDRFEVVLHAPNVSHFAELRQLGTKLYQIEGFMGLHRLCSTDTASNVCITPLRLWMDLENVQT